MKTTPTNFLSLTSLESCESVLTLEVGAANIPVGVVNIPVGVVRDGNGNVGTGNVGTGNVVGVA